jgi:hypothetical protein
LSDRIKRLNISAVKRNAPKRGPTSSDNYNDSFDEIVNDLAGLQSEWNNKLLPLSETIPNGDDDTTVDAFTNGLDGKTLYVDSSVDSSSTEQTYYNSPKIRPSTIKEAFDALYLELAAEVESLTTQISEASSGLTTAQKEEIGINIFDSTQTSSATSLDGKSESSRLNVIQLAKDLYGGTYTLAGTGNSTLVNSVRDMVNTLLTLHNGSWDTDITLSHTGIASAQTAVASSSTYNDSYAGSPTTTEDDLNQVRTRIKTVTGTVTWTTSLSALYAGGPDSIEELMTSTQGTGTKTVTNPWGYNYTDIDGLSTQLSNLQNNYRYETGFTGVSMTINHGKGMYPIVDLVQIDPVVTLSGECPFTVNHTSLNAFTLALTSGVVVSGVVVALF